jgi:hypothetical protein
MVDFAGMLSLDDKRWPELLGGYRAPFDARPLLSRLETEPDTTQVWHELWNELHHQGDVGEASYAAVPYIVRNHRERGVADWNAYAFVAIVELARNDGSNPHLPKWLEEDYCRAIRDLAETGSAEVLRTDEPDTVRAILSIIAIAKDLRTHGKFLVNYSEDEMLEIESRI